MKAFLPSINLHVQNNTTNTKLKAQQLRRFGFHQRRAWVYNASWWLPPCVRAGAPQYCTGEVLCLLCWEMRAHPLQSNVNPSAAPPLSPSLNQQSIYSNSRVSLRACVCACVHAWVWAPCMYAQTKWSLMITKVSQGRRNNGLNQRRPFNEQNLTDKICCVAKDKK